jgi:hypothetical protein
MFGTFLEMNVDAMDEGTVRGLMEILQGVLADPSFAHRYADYADLYDRLRKRLHALEMAAARAQGDQRLKTVSSYRESIQRNKQRALSAKTYLFDHKINPTRVDASECVSLGSLLEDLEKKEKIRAENPGTKTGPARRAKEARDLASTAVDSALKVIIARIQKEDEEAKQIHLGQITPKSIPVSFKVEGWRELPGRNYRYPMGGYIKIGNSNSTYLVNPNRTTKHVTDELAAGASMAIVEAYLASFVTACEMIIGQLKPPPKGQYSSTVNLDVPHQTPSNRNSTWRMIAMRFAKTNAQGHLGQVFHADTFYEKSRWRLEQ